MDASNDKNKISNLTLINWIGFCLTGLILTYFLGFYDAFIQGRESAFTWLYVAWNPETDYEHGWMVPLFAIFLFRHSWQASKDIPKSPSFWGLLPLAFGAFVCVLSVRTQQARIAIATLPFLLVGLIACYWGVRTALKNAFPCFFLWLAIPIPGIQQATVGLQLMASELAHFIASLAGVATIIDGTNVSSATGNWDTYSIAGGCSGIRSLMALVMISIAWGYLASGLSLWKRFILAGSAIPFALIANALRVASIFIFAEYLDPSFAGQTWHDWSGMLIFFPASVLGLSLLHSLLAGSLPFISKKTIVVRKHNSPTV